MFRSLHIAATGMAAQEAQLDSISQNLANVNTVGYKKVRADFEDLLYQTLRAPGAPTSGTTNSPTGLQVGSGARIVANTRMHTQGTLQQTGNPLDIAIEGNGFFVIQQPDGTPAYTRAGNLKTDGQGRIVNSDGYPLEPPISVPADATSLSIGADGTVSVTMKGQTNSVQLGQLELATFVNPTGLASAGHNLYTSTTSSGDPQIGKAGTEGRGTLLQGSIEHANVEVVEEMIGLIAAQRNYEVNSKVVSAADEMLRNATQMR
ncbi:MAG TPA: flagellar basal-body rod protein FlgG [Polyangiaceae bacterium]|nr:flagellar basal-body rod protein FlgG [Polyangiaceae bacterium]